MCVAETARTTIHLLTVSDAEFFFELVNSPSWLKYIGDREIGTVESAAAYLETNLISLYKDPGYSYYAVRTRDQISIGIVGFLKRPGRDYVDFGFAFLPEYQGQGFGFEAAKCVLEYGIQEYKFDMIDAITKPDNLASQALLTKLGFRLNDRATSSDEHGTQLIFRKLNE